MKIIDAHHHVWRQADLPWLLGPTQPRIFGEYDPIKRGYTIDEYLQDIAGTGVAKSVYVQANWAPERFEEEAAWVQRNADTRGWPHGIVGYCDMMQDDARRDLDKLAKYPLMRGIRQQLHWHENPAYRFASAPDLALNETIQRNIGYLIDYGWCFELQVFPAQMQSAAKLAASCPRVTFVLQHAGMLEDLSEAGRESWRERTKELAGQENVVTKLSAFGTFIHRNDPKHIEWLVKEALSIFGPDRCLFGSNFPIEKLWTSYSELLGAFLRVAKGLDEKAAHAIFFKTARRIYRL